MQATPYPQSAGQAAAISQRQPLHAVPRAQTVGVWLAGTAAALALVATPPASAADLVMGRTVFENNCAACHTGGYNSVQPEKTLRKEALESYLTGGFNIEAIEYQVENGKNAMPAWGDRLSEEEIQAVAAYVYDQAAGARW